MADRKRYRGGAWRLSTPERLALLDVDTVIRLSLEGMTIRSALDAGTGTGIVAAAFALRGLRVAGLDVNEELLERARAAAPGMEFRTGAVEADDPLAALREARRVAGARVAILEWPYRSEKHGPPLDHRLRPERIRQLDLFRLAP